MKKVLLVLLAVLLAAATGAGGFYGGMTYGTNTERNQANQIQADFFRQRGGMPAGTPDANNLQRRAAGFGGGGVNGQVKSISGNTLTISTGQNETKVTLSATTQILKTDPAVTGDLQAGEQVLITGERDANGNLTAIQILIMPGTPATPGTTP